MATMMVTPETLTGTGGETSEVGVSAVAVKETVELPPVMLSMVKPQILRFKATEILNLRQESQPSYVGVGV